MHIKVAGQSINATLAPAAIKDGKDERQLQGFYEKGPDAQLGYTFPNLLTEYVMKNTHVPVGPWRGVNTCLLYTSPSPRDGLLSRMPSSA